jgi:hypothetical protein
MPTFRENLSVPASSVKNAKRKPAVPIRCLNREKCVRGKVLSSVAPVSRVDASSWEVGVVGTVVVQLGRQTFCDRRNSNRCDKETNENIHMRKVGERKRKESAIRD